MVADSAVVVLVLGSFLLRLLVLLVPAAWFRKRGGDGDDVDDNAAAVMNKQGKQGWEDDGRQGQGRHQCGLRMEQQQQGWRLMTIQPVANLKFKQHQLMDDCGTNDDSFAFVT